MDQPLTPLNELKQVLDKISGHDPDLAIYFQSLAIRYRNQYKQNDGLDDLDAAVECFKAAVRLTPEDHPGYSDHVQNLGVSFSDRYRRLGNLEDLENAVLNDRLALALTPEGHPDVPERAENLGSSLTDRYLRLGHLADLEAALQAEELARDLTPRLVSLAVSLLDRFNRTGTTDDIDTALKHAEAGVALTPPGHSTPPGHLQMLSMAFSSRYNSLGNVEDLEASLKHIRMATDLTPADHPDLPDIQGSIAAAERALTATPQDHPQRASSAVDLALSLLQKYRRLGDIEDLERAQKTAQTAVDQILPDDVNLPELQNILGACLTSRHERSGDAESMEAALQHRLATIAVTAEGHPSLPSQLNNLAVCYLGRYKVLGDLDDLVASAKHGEDAVQQASRHDSDLSVYLNQLAASFMIRYMRFGNLQDLEAAVKNDQEAVVVTPEGHPDLPRRLSGLTSSLQARYNRLGNLEDIEMALQHIKAAVDLTPQGHPELPTYLHYQGIPRYSPYQTASELVLETDPHSPDLLTNYAMLLLERFWTSGAVKDLLGVFQMHQTAFTLTPSNHPDLPKRLSKLAHTMRVMYLVFQNPERLEAAIEADEIVLEVTPEGHPDRPEYLQMLGRHLMERYDKFQDPQDIDSAFMNYSTSFETPTSDPMSSWHAAMDWASFAQVHKFSDVSRAYSAAFKLLPEILWVGNPLNVRHEGTRKINIGEATSNAFRACVLCGDLPLGVEFLEQGLATTFQQMLQLKTEVDSLPQGDAKKLEQLSSQLYDQKSPDLLAIAADRNKLLQDIRQRPGFKYFLCPKSFKELRGASQKGPVVMLNSHKEHCDAIVILNPTSDPVHIPLLDVAVEKLFYYQTLLQDILQRSNSRTRQSDSSRLFGSWECTISKPIDECFEEMLTWLWKVVVQPIYNALEFYGVTKGRLWWCPVGVFTSLPIHAAAPSDQFIQSYTSTLGALLNSSSKKSKMPAKLGIVGVTHSNHGGVSSLPAVERELDTIISIVDHNHPVRSLIGAQATVAAVNMQLNNCSWAHLACHGKQDLYDPPKSCLQLYDGSLDLETILKMSLPHAEFVFLAACQTAMGHSELINESFHLGGGLIAAGFRAAIGTMWSMRDDDGPIVAGLVYKHLFADGRQPQATDTAEALQLAVRKLRDNGVPYQRWMPFIHMGV
ncbi:CHAT domain-containing protein [Mycena rosella]|uniref:CHAT domain-containing protein n=1 Tax=Mycena rosella TaxID=1033263 RepID=A0AAD7D8C6_MYCRO|nr:CHAT domain-containing protein [Mycena rosella]